MLICLSGLLFWNIASCYTPNESFRINYTAYVKRPLNVSACIKSFCFYSHGDCVSSVYKKLNLISSLRNPRIIKLATLEYFILVYSQNLILIDFNFRIPIS